MDDGAEPGRLRCTGCGTQAETAQRWRWSISTDARASLLNTGKSTDERGITTTLCPDCARENARSIEAKLDDGWW